MRDTTRECTRLDHRTWLGCGEAEYIDLDCEQWIRENKIREAGRENGRQNYPPSGASQPDEMYMKTLAWVNQRGKGCYAAVNEYLVQKREELEREVKEGMAPIRNRVESMRAEGIQDLTDQATKAQPGLQQSKHEAREAWLALEEFKERANLNRVAEYDGRDTWYLWLIGIVAVEALVNAMMLAGVHEYGLAGALVIMASIAFVNAFPLAGMIGEGWRQKNSHDLIPKFGGWLLIALGASGTLVGNLLVGHFRDSMKAVTAKGASANTLSELLADDTFERFGDNPFGLEGMLSGLLVAIGTGCCFFAATKWLKRDDIYPGYGARHRAATARNHKFVQDLESRREELNSIHKEYIEKIRDQRLQVENKTGSKTLITETAKAIVATFPMQLRQYQLHLDFILAAYRSENEKARSTPPPKFFAEPFHIDREMLEPPSFTGIRTRNPLDPGWEGFPQAENAIRTAYQEEQKRYPTPEAWMEITTGEARE